jgi:Tol biopolymer transport system component
MDRSVSILVLGLGLLLMSPHAGVGQSRYRPTSLKALNSPEGEDDPYLYVSKNGKIRRLYYVTKQQGKSVLMVSQLKKNGSWEAGKAVEGLQPSTDTRSPCLTPDGHDLYVATKFEGENFDLGLSINPAGTDKFTVPTPVGPLCTPADEMHPWISADGRELYFSRKDKGGWRIYLATRPGKSGGFEKVQCIEELPAGFQHATLTSDGGTMFVQGPLENGRWGLFRFKRSKNLDRSWRPWGEPEALNVLNSTPEEAPVGDMSPSLSRDDGKLYFASDRRDGKGGIHLYEISAANLILGVWKTKAKLPPSSKK